MRITPAGRCYVLHNVVNGVPDDPDFRSDAGILLTTGHYSAHPAPRVADNIQAM